MTDPAKTSISPFTKDAPPEWPKFKIPNVSTTTGTWTDARAYLALTEADAKKLRLIIRQSQENKGVAGALLEGKTDLVKEVVQEVMKQAEHMIDALVSGVQEEFIPKAGRKADPTRC